MWCRLRLIGLGRSVLWERVYGPFHVCLRIASKSSAQGKKKNVYGKNSSSEYLKLHIKPSAHGCVSSWPRLSGAVKFKSSRLGAASNLMPGIQSPFPSDWEVGIQAFVGTGFASL